MENVWIKWNFTDGQIQWIIETASQTSNPLIKQSNNEPMVLINGNS